MTRLAPVVLGVVMCFIAPAGTLASTHPTVPVRATISIQPPQWARKGLTGVTFVGKVSGGPGCTTGRRVGLYQDGYGQLGPFVRAGSWAGHGRGYWTITVNAPGRPFTHFYAVALEEFRSPSFAKPNRLNCKYAITRPLPPRW
jgi:hypothetical protein